MNREKGNELTRITKLLPGITPVLRTPASLKLAGSLALLSGYFASLLMPEHLQHGVVMLRLTP
jgi:hypothetical protein